MVCCSKDRLLVSFRSRIPAYGKTEDVKKLTLPQLLINDSRGFSSLHDGRLQYGVVSVRAARLVLPC